MRVYTVTSLVSLGDTPNPETKVFTSRSLAEKHYDDTCQIVAAVVDTFPVGEVFEHQVTDQEGKVKSTRLVDKNNRNRFVLVKLEASETVSAPYEPFSPTHYWAKCPTTLVELDTENKRARECTFRRFDVSDWKKWEKPKSDNPRVRHWIYMNELRELGPDDEKTGMTREEVEETLDRLIKNSPDCGVVKSVKEGKTVYRIPSDWRHHQLVLDDEKIEYYNNGIYSWGTGWQHIYIKGLTRLELYGIVGENLNIKI